MSIGLVNKKMGFDWKINGIEYIRRIFIIEEWTVYNVCFVGISEATQANWIPIYFT